MVSTRIRCGWKQFHDLAPFLTSRAPSLRVKAQVYSACVRSALTYASETWAVRKDHLEKLQRVERAMVRWMCGVNLSDRERSELLERKGLEDIVNVLRRSRLRWFGHVQRKQKEEWTKRSLHFDVEGKRPVGRPKKIWSCHLYTSPSPRDLSTSRMPSSA